MISILITNYNKEKYLNKNLNLLLKSSLKNFEIILFDDVSTDNSLEIIEKFKKVKIIKNKKKKFTSPALNQIFGISKCLKKAKGELICLLDSDDFFDKNKLKIIQDFFLKNKKKTAFIIFQLQMYKNLNLNKKNQIIFGQQFFQQVVFLLEKKQW